MDNKLKRILNDLELDGVTANIYMFLFRKGRSSISKISRSIGVSRYLVDVSMAKLTNLNLVRTMSVGKSVEYEITSIKILVDIVNDRKRKLEMIKVDLKTFISTIPVLQGESGLETKVITYSGRDGFKNITKNTCNSRGVFRIFEIDYLGVESDFKFAEEIRRQFVKNGIKICQLTNSPIYPFKSNIQDIFKEQFWELRYIDKNLLNMKYELAVYNDVFSLYRFDESGVFFGVEIYNDQLANIQKQIFDFMWNGATRMKYNSEREEMLLTR